MSTSNPAALKTSSQTNALLDALCVNTLRCLAMDAVQRANSGHPGLPMGAAAMTYVLWDRFLRHNPSHPQWPNRDRFVLSAGHGCMLLYGLLHLTGYDLPLEEIKQFRQWGSRTPGHPERDLNMGIETTTGPLGQGFGNGVGMGIAQKFLAAHFNRPGHELLDYKIFALVSDGDLMEGVASEAASLAGHLGLDNLIYLYDNNHISIEGSTELAFTEQVAQRFEAYGWFVQTVTDGNDLAAVDHAISAAKQSRGRPSIIMARTQIAFGSPNKQGSAAAHGAALGEEEVRLTKKNLGWPATEPFFIPPEALGHFRQAVARGQQAEEEWNRRLAAYRQAHPELAAEWNRFVKGELAPGWQSRLPVFRHTDGPLATRQASGKVLNAIAPALPWLVGGSADLAPSTDTYLKGEGDFSRENYAGRNFHFGVREHAMGSLLSGMALSGLIPYGGTFLIFSDYLRPTLRLAAMMGAPSIFVFTHDSIFLGEDGPTHEPIEHLPSLRAIHKLCVIRPCDANETAMAWKVAIERRDGPVALVLTRQSLPVLDRTRFAPAEGLERGAYVLARIQGQEPEIALIASGSEVALAVQVFETLAAEGRAARVVSMPSWDLFARQPADYQEQVLPQGLERRVAIEAASPFGWERYTGSHGIVIGIERYGASAPYKVLAEQFGFTAAKVLEKVRRLY